MAVLVTVVTVGWLGSSWTGKPEWKCLEVFSPSLKSESCPVIRCLRFQAVLSPWSVAMDFGTQSCSYFSRIAGALHLSLFFFFFSSLAFSSFKVKGVFSQPSRLYFSGQDLIIREAFVVPQPLLWHHCNTLMRMI